MICPNCGENNSANFRYCGMCGTSLEPRRPAGAPRTVSASEMARPLQSAQSVASEPQTQARGGIGEAHSTPATAGPSFLGLNHPFTDGHGSDSKSNTSTDQPFAGLDSFFEQDEPGVSARGIIFLLVLLGALGAGGWWAYTRYNGAKPASGSTSQTAAPAPATQADGAETPAENASNSKPADASSSPSPSTNPAASQPTAASPAESANSTPPPAAEPKSDSTSPATPKPAERNIAQNNAPERTSRNQKVARVETKPAPRPPAATPASSDRGDAEFKRGEAYLYGRGMPENCNEAIKSLKAASAKQNSKARSAFGTMYATGHCVPRDLPTSYSWFAQALRADPNNPILEKDLTAVWNQMTPPERQMAAKAKP